MWTRSRSRAVNRARTWSASSAGLSTSSARQPPRPEPTVAARARRWSSDRLVGERGPAGSRASRARRRRPRVGRSAGPAEAWSHSSSAACGTVPPVLGNGRGPSSRSWRNASSGTTNAAPSARRSMLSPNASASGPPSSPRRRRRSQSRSSSSRSVGVHDGVVDEPASHPPGDVGLPGHLGQPDCRGRRPGRTRRRSRSRGPGVCGAPASSTGALSSSR